MNVRSDCLVGISSLAIGITTVLLILSGVIT
jgi:hypothetical protein